MTEPPESREERVEVARTPACGEMEDLLPDAARILREGGDLASHYPDLVRHLEGCEWCREALEELVKEPDVRYEPEAEVDWSERFDGYRAAALEEPEPIARVHAAEKIGEADRVGPRTLAALAKTAVEDSDAEVRRVALKALDELDAAVSIPERLIEAWSVAPEEAAPFIEGVLERLAGDQPPASAAVIGLGKEGVRGSVSMERGELRLTVEGLPPSFETTKPVVAVPGALDPDAPEVEWYGNEPGLVTAQDAVREGRLDVRLGRMLDPTAEPALTPELERLFVFNPKASREKA